MSKIRVQYRKLGKEQADGIAHLDRKLIEIDERLKGKRLFSCLLHECIHHVQPTLTEEEVLRVEKEITAIMWQERKRWTNAGSGV